MRLLIVDDDPLILASLKMSLSRQEDITVITTANDGAEAVDICKKEEPDAILMDIRMPGMDGINATRLIKSRYPQIKIMMLTTFDDRPNIQQALSAGADGYLIKTDKISNIAEKLRVMLDGVSILGTDVLKKLTPKENPALETLTLREREIAALISQGLTNKEIASRLFLSEGTVRNNTVVIMEKLNVKNRTQLGMAYYSND